MDVSGKDTVQGHLVEAVAELGTLHRAAGARRCPSARVPFDVFPSSLMHSEDVVLNGSGGDKSRKTFLLSVPIKPMTPNVGTGRSLR